ncbi:peroxiredoxin family protein [Bacillus taeanensis]|uniref:TlpA family protein disulfide reductase n=1 Tax=Bacillus taeanensis TaxID=273032 RepID=A0A366XS96_9BACI|nr:TlpA disulfide reductase family protein [Bacillus taeanensis]RBW69002.1 TlpA family protein disulfide reductase [Bacillus taeanensis]
MIRRSVLLGMVAVFALITWGFYEYISNENVLNAGEKNQENEESVPAAASSGEIGLEKGDKAPNFTLENLKGEQVSLSDFRGKKVLLNFWATWCPPCKEEMPEMEEFYEKNGAKMEIIAVNLTMFEHDQANVAPFIKEYGLTFPVLLDKEGEQAKVYQAITIPTSYIVDEKGIIQQKIVGPMTYEMMEKIIQN